MIERDSNIWQELFPDERRRSLAFDFIDRVSYLPFIEAVVSLEVRDETGFEIPTVYILVNDCYYPFEDDQLAGMYKDVCPDFETQDILGHIRVTTPDKFLEGDGADWQCRFKMATVLFNRVSQNRKDFEGVQNFNSELN